MQPWQIKVLELEQTALHWLDGILADYGVYVFIIVANLLVLLLVWTLSGGLRRKLKYQPSHVHPVIIIQSPETLREDVFDPFPPVRECDCDCDHEHWED